VSENVTTEEKRHLQPVGVGVGVGVGNAARTGKSAKNRAKNPAGVQLERHFTRAGEDPFASVEWELRSAKIANEKGEAVFEQNDVEIPKSWSQLATNVVVSK
jgi:ribonucleoside-diphosphate reductase alpha chain